MHSLRSRLHILPRVVARIRYLLYRGDPQRGLFSLALIALVAVGIPIGEIPWFSGLPLDGLPEAIGLILLMPLLAVRSVRRVIVAECRRIVSGRSGRVAGMLLAIAIAAKIGLLLSGGQVGWHACYRAVDQPILAESCERSYDNVLFADSATRFDEELAFGQVAGGGPSAGLSDSSWNLTFFNSLRWNQLKPQGYRERLPFEVEWTADAEPADDEIDITYVGEGMIEFGGRTRLLPASYAHERTVVLRGSPSHGSVLVRLGFDPQDTRHAATPGPYASIRLSGLDPAGPTTAQRIMGWAVDLPLLVLLATLLLCYGVLARRLRWHWIPAIVLALALVIPSGPQDLAGRTTLSLIVILAAVLFRPSLRGLLFAAVAVILVNSIRVGHEFATWDSVIYRTAGNDFLGYESFARDILETGSLRGGEDVFVSQPGIRYIIFAARALLGDSDALLSVASRSLVSIGIVFALGAACAFLVRRSLGRATCFVAGACVLVVLNFNPELVSYIDAGLSEWPTWAGIPIGVAMLVLAPSRRWVLIGTAILALCVITRTNLAPALMLAVAAGLWRIWRPDRRLVLVCAGVFGAILCLPLAHNLAFGQQAVLATTSGPANVVLPLGDLPSALHDSEIREQLERQIRLMLYAAPESSSDAILISLRVLQAAWLLGTILVLVRWRRTSGVAKALVLAPGLMLAPYLMYDSFPYYPRHIVAGHILMATMLAVVVAPVLTAERSRAGFGWQITPDGTAVRDGADSWLADSGASADSKPNSS